MILRKYMKYLERKQPIILFNNVSGLWKLLGIKKTISRKEEKNLRNKHCVWNPQSVWISLSQCPEPQHQQSEGHLRGNITAARIT